MVFAKKNRGAGGTPGEKDSFFGKNNFPHNNHRRILKQPAIVGRLAGDSWCKIGEAFATGRTPVLTACRALLAQGIDPDTALEIYRNGTLALRVRSIEQAAKLRVATHGVGFERLPECTGATYSDFSEAADQLQFLDGGRP
jgi:hypothetical protein